MNENQKNKPNTQSSTDGGNFREVDPIFHSRPEFEQFLPKRYLMPQTENAGCCTQWKPGWLRAGQYTDCAATGFFCWEN